MIRLISYHVFLLFLTIIKIIYKGINMIVLHKGTTSSTPDITQLSSKELGINVVTGEIYLKTYDSNINDFVLMRHRPLNTFVGLTYNEGDLSVNLNNTLNSTSTSEALTAAQGKVLNDKINNLAISGKLYQIQSKVITTQSSQTITTSDTQIGVNTDYELSITTLAANSKIRIDIRYFGELESKQSQNTVFNVLRGSSRINVSSNDSWDGLIMANMSGGVSSTGTPETLQLATIDEPNVAANTTLTYHLVASCNNNTTTLWANRGSTSPGLTSQIGSSEIILTEIGV